MVQPGDSVTVRVLGVDDEKGKISLGMKQLRTDPWDEAGQSYTSGQRLTGTVTRVLEFGAFIELQPGIEALAHLSTFPPSEKRDGWKETVTVGATVAVEILTVDLERKRIGVAVTAEGSENHDARAYSKRQSEVQEASFGSMADKLRSAFRPADE